MESGVYCEIYEVCLGEVLLEFFLLGPVQASATGRLVNLGVRKQRFVLALLALEVNKQVTTERLVELTWPQDPPMTARGMIHTYISGLRAAVAGSGGRHAGVRIDRGPAGYTLYCDPGRVDVHRFRALLAEARNGDDARRVELLSRALALWRGPALSGAAPEEVRENVCRGLDESRLTAVEDLVEARLRLGRHESLLEELLALAAEHPRRPRLTGGLMQALHRAGRTAEALEIYERTRQRLGEELGLDPPAELRELHLAIMRNDSVPDRPPAPAGEAAPVPRQLPADLPTFTGRAAELARLLDMVGDEARSSATVVIGAIDGMAGVGKTALAVHAAHHLAARFPDGQLFVDLHGFTYGVAPTTPTDALDGLLRALGVPGERIPHQLDDRASLLRTTLAGRRMLILLDNAATENQVLPLLPGSPGCVVLITSRRRLTGLDDAHRIRLDVLPTGDAIAMFSQVAGADHPPERITEVVGLCGRLPLALRIATARLHARPAWTLAHLVDRLRDERRRLAELEVGQRSVTAAVDLSYQQLTSAQQRLFRLLGLRPGTGPGIRAALPEGDPGSGLDVYAAAALIDSPLQHADRLLGDLLEANLVFEPAPGRYRFHDLLRVYAVARADAEESPGERRAALVRLLDHYVHTASEAMEVLHPLEAPPHPPGRSSPTPAPLFGAPAEAARWMEAELFNLLAAAEHAAAHDLPVHALHLSMSLHRHLRNHARHTGALHELALRAARQAEDLPCRAEALVSLGHARLWAGRPGRAETCLGEALDLAREIGYGAGELNALTGLGHVHLWAGRRERAEDCFRQALTVAGELIGVPNRSL
ncbi:BTAD domain-containing putative transcriptional regulator [Streptosporangium sp. NPDC023615]|uniref:AfsR/SARP family transcriptional regulator n=1 Tax=Streptosporangium sp. NPDC023615 TaxID=3154794 RepID=UPI00344A1A5D